MSKRKSHNKKKIIPKKYSGLNKKQIEAFNIYVNKGEAYYKQGEIDKALNVFLKAEEIVPNHAMVKFKMGVWLKEKKRMAEAAHYLEKGLALEPDYVPALTSIIDIYKATYRFDKARPHAEKALALAPEKPSVHLSIGNLKHNEAQLSEAIKHYRKALQLKLNNDKDNVRTPKQKPADSEERTQEIEVLMWKTLSELARDGIHAFACFGTLLGLVREGGILPNDHDIDFGVPFSELPRVQQCMENNGWILANEQNLTNPLPYYHPVKQVTLDVSGFVADKSGRCYEGVWINDVPQAEWRTTQFPPLRLKKGKNPNAEPIWVLENPETWLESLYGDWKTPDRNFDTIICAQNLCGFTPLTQCYAYLRIYNKWISGHPEKALALLRYSRQQLPEDKMLEQVESHLSQLIN